MDSRSPKGIAFRSPTPKIHPVKYHRNGRPPLNLKRAATLRAKAREGREEALRERGESRTRRSSKLHAMQRALEGWQNRHRGATARSRSPPRVTRSHPPSRAESAARSKTPLREQFDRLLKMPVDDMKDAVREIPLKDMKKILDAMLHVKVKGATVDDIFKMEDREAEAFMRDASEKDRVIYAAVAKRLPILVEHAVSLNQAGGGKHGSGGTKKSRGRRGLLYGATAAWAAKPGRGVTRRTAAAATSDPREFLRHSLRILRKILRSAEMSAARQEKYGAIALMIRSETEEVMRDIGHEIDEEDPMDYIEELKEEIEDLLEEDGDEDTDANLALLSVAMNDAIVAGKSLYKTIFRAAAPAVPENENIMGLIGAMGRTTIRTDVDDLADLFAKMPMFRGSA